ncbi:MAG TPA: lysine--tRNA ligase [Flavobacteriaceae bacterium]|nr:lysine--tRNA ligase [Flavobacteriaceae bacterium]
MSNLSEQEIVRREKLNKLIKMGINPYPADLFPITTNSQEIKENFKHDNKVVIAGRIMSRRIQGNASFAEIQDNFGRIQLYLNRDEICAGEDKTLYNEVYKKLLDIGDIIGIEGTLFKTKVGEKTVLVKNFTILNKSIRPLPLPKKDAEGNVYDEFNDSEQRYRQRYVDLIVNPSVKETFIKRTKITNSIRSFLNEKGYLEVETPILQPIPGGAAARPFLTHHNALNIPLYLRIANELYLKRLIVGGFDGVYEFAKDFRNEGMDRSHNPEFTMLEFYVAYKDYFWMMKTTEKLLEKVAIGSNGNTKIKLGKETIEFKAPYPRIPILEAIKKYTGVDISNMDEDELRGRAKKMGIEVDKTMGYGKLVDAIFGQKCEHEFIQPTFIIDYPKEMSPLTKQHRSNPKLTERFELIIDGKEIANGYSELNDPIDQKNRFEDQLKLSKKGDPEATEFIDYDFLRALEYGMPPTSGIGIGIDRLVMLITNNSSIQEVLLFPQMKPERKKVELSENEKVVYSLLSEEQVKMSGIKEKSALSNKAWDKSTKNLRKMGLVVVEKKDDDIYISKSK